jgi:hypothetical protein
VDVDRDHAATLRARARQPGGADRRYDVVPAHRSERSQRTAIWMGANRVPAVRPFLVEDTTPLSPGGGEVDRRSGPASELSLVPSRQHRSGAVR